MERENLLNVEVSHVVKLKDRGRRCCTILILPEAAVGIFNNMTEQQLLCSTSWLCARVAAWMAFTIVAYAVLKFSVQDHFNLEHAEFPVWIVFQVFFCAGFHFQISPLTLFFPRGKIEDKRTFLNEQT